MDAIVIGSGAAGLTAALALLHAGADVMLVEAEDVLGGTSAIGGGNLWIPGSGPMARAGYPDDPAAARTYLRRVGGAQPLSDNVDAFVRHGARMVDFIEVRGALRFSAIPRHDYHPDWEGAGFGRSLEPEPFSAGALLKERASWFRINPGRAPLTYVEYRAGGDAAMVAARRAEDIRTQGAALVAGLGYSCLDMGVNILRGIAVNAVHRQPNGGFAITLADGRHADAASVVIASGGFAADPAKRRALLPAVDFVPLTAGRGRGDGLRFGFDCGADLFGLGDGWLGAVHAPDDGRPPFLVVRELALPGSMLVNGDGRRFVNEALGYNDVGRGMLAFDPARGSYFCARAWLIFDAAFKARFPVLGVAPNDPEPKIWRQADDLAELARMLSMPAHALEQSAERMNEAADSGIDKAFGRGGDPHQRFNGDPANLPNPCLGHISTPPYYAAPIVPGLCGTKGGLLVDAEARVLDRSGDPIRGLYACGDAAPTVMGFGYAGAGASLGPGMTAALLAAESIVGQKTHEHKVPRR